MGAFAAMKPSSDTSDFRAPRRVSSRARLALAFGALVLSLAGAELLVRLVAPQPPSWMAIYERHSRRPSYVHRAGLDVEVATGETHFRVFTDPVGHRRAERPAARDGEPVCIWLGDSFTFGQGLNYAKTFVGIVDASTKGYRHINAGVAGYGPVQYREALEDELARGTLVDRIVIVTYVGNDFHDCVWSKDVPVRDGVLGDSGGILAAVKRTSHLYRFASATYHRIDTSPGNPFAATFSELGREESWTSGFLRDCRAKFVKEMGEIVDIARRQGASVQLVVIPTTDAIAARRSADIDGDPERPVREAVAIGQSLEIIVIDTLGVLAEYDPRETYFARDMHLNELGSRRVAEAILEKWHAERPPR